jgi:multisubunit Na+/H+ antiporter MnhB subunit
MLKKFSILITTAFFYLSYAFEAYAVKINPCPDDPNYSNICKYDLKTLGNIISNSITILFIVATVAALFFLVFGGIKWVTSGGDKAQVETARNWIVAAVVGLVITFLSYFILNIVMQLFGLPTFGSDIDIPKLIKP